MTSKNKKDKTDKKKHPKNYCYEKENFIVVSFSSYTGIWTT